ncbi:Tn3 family transposase [Nonomuraea sp. NEAU-A123]|uniref:Tn3 family transposase n=1 Tax=Nonomuraea sp. NEAU-A123 TaxID=2839649 RepID=UPI0020330BB9|nr:Tn3 family transposase [Nonomuraea sp. NEAU-A123]
MERLRSYPDIGREELIRFFTLTRKDLGFVDNLSRGGGRGSAARLGLAVQLCTLPWLGFVPDDIRSVPQAAVQRLANQLAVFRGALEQYGRRAQTRSDHLKLVLKYLGWKPVPTRGETLKELEQFLLDRAMEHDTPSLLFHQAAEYLISSKVVRPGVVVLMKMVGSARNAAGALTSEKVDHLLTGPMRADLDRLLVHDPEIGTTRLAWLTTPAVEATPTSIKLAIDRLMYLRAMDAHLLDLSMLPRERRRFLATLGRRSTVQGLERRGERRYPILLALVAQSAVDQLDEVIALFDQAVSARESHAKAKTDAALAERAKKGEARQLLMDVILPVLIDPAIADEQVGGMLRERIGMNKLREVAAVSWKPLPRDHGRLAALEASHTYLRKFTPRVLEAIDFQGGPGTADLMDAVAILKDLNRTGGRKVPAEAPTSFVPARYTDYLAKARKSRDDTAFRHYWEICTILALRDGLRSGDVFVPGSRRYADPGTYLFTPEQWEAKRAEFCHLVRKPADAAEAIEQVKDELHQALEDLEETLASSAPGDVGAVRLDEAGRLVIPPLSAEDIPAEAKELRDELSSMLPFVPIASLLIELDARTHFLDCFTHAGGRKSKLSVEQKRNILAVLIAGATNLGLTRMSEACGVSYDTLAWTQEWYVREETLREANTILVNHHYSLELAKKFGGGTMSSSDGQRFPVRGKSLTARDMTIHGGRVLSTYTHVSDQWSTYGTKQIVPTTREGHYTLDELLGNETDLPIHEHATDTHGATLVNFGLFDLVGKILTPRMRDLGRITMLRVDTPAATNALYPHAGPLLADRWNEDLIHECYSDLLRMGGSLKFGEATASLIVGKWSAASRQNTLAAALKEWGRMQRTVHAARYLSDPVYRRKISRQLNKGESLHALRRDLHYAQQGTIVRAQLQDQTEQAWCLTILTNAVITWTTEYYGMAIKELRGQGREVPDELLSFIAPGHRENINFFGFITVDIEAELAKLIEGWRPLRPTRVHDAGLPFLLNP